MCDWRFEDVRRQSAKRRPLTLVVRWIEKHSRTLLHMVTPETYGDVFDRLDRDHVRYVVVSGMAVVLHGYLRPLADLDIVVDRTPDQARQMMMTLMASGFVPTILLPPEAVTVLRMFDHQKREVDVFLRYHIPFEELWSDAQQVQVGDRLVRAASLKHLIRAKRVMGRAHDLQDIEGLLALAKPGQDRDKDVGVQVSEMEVNARG